MSPLLGRGSPLRVRTFRRVWISSLFSNLGQQVQIVAVAWAMIELAASPSLVGLVQTAAMAPVMLLALPAGALADLYDKRILAILGLLICAAGALLLLAASLAGLLTPHVLLLGCFVSGLGASILSPSWQSSVAEQVGREALPSAVALYGVSANLGRCAGPALGGLIVAALSQSATFALNAAFYLPMIWALMLWRRVATSPAGPSDTIVGAIRGGVRYVAATKLPRNIVVRAYLGALGSVAALALSPIISSQHLNVGVHRFGLLLAAFGAGGALALFAIHPLRQHWTPQRTIAVCGLALTTALVTLAFSKSFPLSALAMALAGTAWMISMSVFNLEVQLAAPASITGRVLAIFSASVAFGLATGGALWGFAADHLGLTAALCLAGGYVLATLVAGMAMPLHTEATDLPETALKPVTVPD